MKPIINFLMLIACSLQSISQSVGINASTPDISAQLEIRSTNKGLLIPRLTLAQRNAITTPANGLVVYQTDGQQGIYYNAGTSVSPSWQNTAGNNWGIGGNALLATGNFGTTSNNHIDIVTNNVVRGRFTNLGEVFIGTTSTVVPGDLFGAVSNATFPFAVSGYASFNGAAVYGAVTGGTTQYAAVQGEYQSTNAGIFNTAGVRGSNQSNTAGTGFRTQAGTGPRVGVIGNTTATSGQYTFGIHGSMNSTDIRCGAIIGDDFGIALGALAYYASNQADYSVYGFGNAFQQGVVGGSANAGSTYTTNTQIGLGIYGGVMGGWIRGLAFGAHVKGEAYSLYVDGNTYVNKPITELVTTLDENRVPAYSITSLSTELLAKGKAIMENGSTYIRFESNFANLVSANPDDVIITVTPTSSSSGVYISQQDALGFTVRENVSSGQPVQINWIAMGTRLQTVTHTPEVLAKDFDSKMNGVMFNENNTGERSQSIWWDGTRVRFDTPPPKVTDPKTIYNTRYVPNSKGIQ